MPLCPSRTCLHRAFIAICVQCMFDGQLSSMMLQVCPLSSLNRVRALPLLPQVLGFAAR